MSLLNITLWLFQFVVKRQVLLNYNNYVLQIHEMQKR